MSEKSDISFVEALLHAYWTGDDSLLRSITEGRAYLLELAKERRKDPLWLRRAPRVAGEHAAKTFDDIRMKYLSTVKGGH